MPQTTGQSHSYSLSPQYLNIFTVLEHLFYHLEENNQLSDCQYGFRKHRSTQAATAVLPDELSATDAGLCYSLEHLILLTMVHSWKVKICWCKTQLSAMVLELP